MGQGEKILVIGRHASILANVARLLTQHGYSVVGVQANEEAIETFKKATFDAVIIGGGVDTASRACYMPSFVRTTRLSNWSMPIHKPFWPIWKLPCAKTTRDVTRVMICNRSLQHKTAAVPAKRVVVEPV